MSSDGNAIAVDDLTKTYRVGVGRARVREMLPWPFDGAVQRAFPHWWARDTFDALHGVSFTVPTGSSVGIVGHNGAGKTTLLRVIAGITSPSSGTVHVPGQIGALLDVLVGFHPDLTGRENIFLLGAMHGLGRREMAGRVEQILEFAEIGELADTPLKRYSAGMSARLGFAIITAIDVAILLIDEVLAVGDASFQRKCIGWLDDFRSNGGTLLFVSHNLALVRNMTDKAIWLDHGRVVEDGATELVLGRYARAMENRPDGRMHRVAEALKQARSRGELRWGAGGARIERVRVDELAEDCSALEIGITYEASGLDRAAFCVGFADESGREIGGSSSPVVALNGGSGAVRCVVRSLPLRPGIYFPIVAIVSADGRVRDRWRLDRAIVLEHNGERDPADGLGPVVIDAHWVAPGSEEA